MPIQVRSSFSEKEGTWVLNPTDPLPAAAHPAEGAIVEQPIIAGVAHDLNDCKITVVGVPDRPGEAAQIFRAVADAGVNVDMIVQNVSVGSSGRTDVTFTCPVASRQAALDALSAQQDAIGFEDLAYDDGIAKVSLVGAGMRTDPGVSATFFKAMADAGINITMITTSEIRISVVTSTDVAGVAVRALHTAFGLDADGEAVVYAGTGR
jgi:aspartate kinase